MTVMTANQARAAIIAGLAIVGVAIVAPCIDNHWAHLAGVVAEAIILTAGLLFIVAVIALNVRDRRDGDSRATGIQLLSPVEDDEPVTLHYQEGSER